MSISISSKIEKYFNMKLLCSPQGQKYRKSPKMGIKSQSKLPNEHSRSVFLTEFDKCNPYVI